MSEAKDPEIPMRSLLAILRLILTLGLIGRAGVVS
jgi:hypothetical protein